MSELQQSKTEKATLRDLLQRRLAEAITLTEDAATVFCVEPFTSINRDGGERFFRLLSRVLDNPEHAAVVVVEGECVFAFKDQLFQTNSHRAEERHGRYEQAIIQKRSITP